MKKNPKHFLWLDSIRFIAALLVLMCHFRGAFLPEWSWLPAEQQNGVTFIFYSLTRLGHEAVLVFFVLSGWFIGGGGMCRGIHGRFNVSEYCVDRSVRIMLPLISALLLFLVKECICGNKVDWSAWFGNLFSLQGIWTHSVIEPLWTLAYEVWFYIMAGAGLCIVFSNNRSAKLVSTLCLIASFLVFTKLSTHYLLIWLMGAFAYLSMPKRGNWCILLMSALGVAVAGAITLLTSGGHLTSEWMQYLPTQNRHSIELIFAAIFCVFLQQVVLLVPRKKVFQMLDRFGTKLAAFSYTLYLVHVLVMRVLQHYGAERASVLSMKTVLLWGAWCGVALLVSYAVYWCFERNTYRVKVHVKRWINSAST